MKVRKKKRAEKDRKAKITNGYWLVFQLCLHTLTVQYENVSRQVGGRTHKLTATKTVSLSQLNNNKDISSDHFTYTKLLNMTNVLLEMPEAVIRYNNLPRFLSVAQLYHNFIPVQLKYVHYTFFQAIIHNILVNNSIYIVVTLS